MLRKLGLLLVVMMAAVAIPLTGCEDDLAGTCESCSSNSSCEPNLTCERFNVEDGTTRNLCASSTTTTCRVEAFGDLKLDTGAQ